MTPSLNEIFATGRKAARGVGLSWGLADEAGRATAWLWQHGLDGPAALAHLLDQHEAGCNTAHCPLHMGTKICDAATTQSVRLADLHSPILLLSFAAELAKITDKAYSLTFGNGVYSASPDGMYCETADDSPRATAILQPADPKGLKLESAPRRPVNSELWRRLGLYEHRTYAPATEASRLAGAGAGLSDND